MSFDHLLVAAAVPRKSVVDGRDIEGASHDAYTIRAIQNSTPRPGEITWDTDHGRVVMSAADRVHVTLPETD